MNQQWKRVLVTGSAGFIGSHLTERLIKLGFQTRALVRYTSSGSCRWLDASPLKKEMEIVFGDVTDRDCIRSAMQDIQIVFHLAALIAIPYSYHAPYSYVRTNVEGTLNLLQCARDAGVDLFIHTSTSEVYGTARYVPIDENHPLQGQSPYSATKIAADKLAEAFHLSYDLPVVTIRPFNTFGPRQSARAIVPTIISQVLAGDEIVLGNLSPRRDLTYVADTVEGFVKAASSPAAIGETINLGTGREISMGDLAKTIMKLAGREGTIRFEDRRVRPEKSEVERLCASNEKAKTLLGWIPTHTLECGLTKTIEWVQHNFNLYDPGRYAV